MSSVVLEDLNQNEIVQDPKKKNLNNNMYLKNTPKCSNYNDASNDQFTFLNTNMKSTFLAVKVRLTSNQLEVTEKLKSPALALDNYNEKLPSPAPQLRSNFFRIMKKQYQFSIVNDEKNANIVPIKTTSNCDGVTDQFSTLQTRRRLNELRKLDPTTMDVEKRLQWIRLELHEMREQDKLLYLQLINIRLTLKEIRNEMKTFEEISKNMDFDDEDDVFFSSLWPRSNSGSAIPVFTSFEHAKIFRSSLSTPPRKLSLQSKKTRRKFLTSLLEVESSE